MLRAALILWALLANAVTAQSFVEVSAEGVTARFDAPTDRYGHAIMGDLPEWGRLCLSVSGEKACVTLPQSSVFEDIAPRLIDVDLDGVPEAVVVESTSTKGAALVVYKHAGHRLLRTATPPIGTRNRWLAPVGAADFDGDGHIEIAFVDRPHLAKTLRLWRYLDDKLIEVAHMPGLTNHRIGEDFISGGVRTCDGQPQMIVANGRWSRVVAVSFDGKTLHQQDVSAFTGRKSMTEALACR